MKPFIMCQECQEEYDNPLNRRYHAQPISCHTCGPTLSFKDISGKIIFTNENALKELAQLIKDGFIVAAPFAVMMKSVFDIEKYCHMSEAEKLKVTSKERPIVILKSKKILSSLIAPFIERLGVFLPYTPLHVMLLDLLDNPIIATSANKSGEPIITNESDLQEKLSHVIDYYLDYNRDIINASDDSILQVIGKRDIVMRASRGMAPMSMRVVSKETKKILAVGAHQKNSIAIYLNNQIILSQMLLSAIYIQITHQLRGLNHKTCLLCKYSTIMHIYLHVCMSII
jgi:hydrogenase maturation protein HypF